ncbi:MAG: DUF4443 domain-containing protein [Candidatus Lokiarchaeia archaeon]
MFEELDSLFQSPTIKPSFEKVHVILALFIFEENKGGIGRYRLQKELLVGSGTARSLIKKLNITINFITVLTDENKRKGHILTKVGLNFLKKIKQKIPLIEAGDPSKLKDIIIKPEGHNPYFCLVRESSDKISKGIEQRDAAIKIGGVGATCLLYNGKNLIFPLQTLSENEKDPVKIENNTFKYIDTLFKKKKTQLEDNDVVIIGLGENPEKARLAALNAALTIL